MQKLSNWSLNIWQVKGQGQHKGKKCNNIKKIIMSD